MMRSMRAVLLATGWLSSIQRLRRRGTKSTLRTTERKLARAQKRALVLQMEVRHQLLLTKELEQQVQQLKHRQQELTLPLPSQQPIRHRKGTPEEQTLIPLPWVQELKEHDERPSPLENLLSATPPSSPS